MRLAYEQLVPQFHSAGYSASQKRALDGGDCIVFHSDSTNAPITELWIAERAGTWYVCVGGLRGAFYEIITPDDVIPLCLEFLQGLTARVPLALLASRMRDCFDVRPIEVVEWARQAEKETNERLVDAGWHLLDAAEEKSRLECFIAAFGFRSGTHPNTFPAINEPESSETWDVNAAIQLWDCDRKMFDATENAFRRSFIGTLHHAGHRDFYLLDPHHQCFRMDLSTVDRNIESWPTTFLPVGAYRVFTDDSLQNGAFGHPWERTVVVFGRQLPAMLHTRSEWDEYRVVRRGGIQCV